MKRQAVCRQRRGVRFWMLPAFARLGCRAAFFQRYGGVSRDAFRGLNLGLNTADDPDRVRRNRKLALQAAGYRSRLPVLGGQVHGCRLRCVTARDAGRGWRAQATAIPATDGLLTAEAGLPVAVATADCLPVLLAAGGGPGVAAVHAGWRGVANGILPKAVRRFRTLWRMQPEQLWAAIGPGIGPEAFVVRGEVLERLGAMFPEALRQRTGGAAGFDLWEAARLQLLHAGIPDAQIIILRESTAAHPRKYFSHRRDHGRTGRMLGMIQREK